MAPNAVPAAFARPEVLAAVLILAVPVAAGWVLAGWRVRPIRARLAFGVAGLLALALASTGQLVAVGVLLAAGGAVGWVNREAAKRTPGLVSILVVALLLLIAAVAGGDSSFAPGSVIGDWFASHEAGWRASLGVLGDRPLFGAGAGNFVRAANAQLPPAASGDVVAPGSFALGIGATAGGLALVALVAGFVIFVVRTRDDWRAPSRQAAGSIAPSKAPALWEYYIGGMAGWVMGFVLQVFDLPAGEPPAVIPTLGLIAGARAVLWFGMFALFAAIPWGAATRRTALTAGVVGAVAYGLVSDGLELPAPAQFLAVSVALALAARPIRAAATKWQWWPVPVAAALTCAYFLGEHDPVTRSAAEVRRAQEAARIYPDRQRAVERAAPFQKREKELEAVKYINALIVNPLFEAARADRDDLALILEMGRWYRTSWELEQNPEIAKRLLDLADDAERLDPLSTMGARSRFESGLRFLILLPPDVPERGAEETEVDWRKRCAASELSLRESQRNDLLKDLQKVVLRDPSQEAHLHFRLAQALYSVRSENIGTTTWAKQQAKEQAFEASCLDRDAPGPRYRLKDSEREQIAGLIDPKPRRPVPKKN
jgi:hypothetical protein